MLINIAIIKIRQVSKTKLVCRLDSSSESNDPKGNINFVHFKQNQGTSSDSFCSSLYSETEILLHFIWIQRLQLLQKTDL